MAELKGLLDSAKRKLGGLLGDFPAGFNAGAVAGIAGYPGDIAYMLDTAGRALTGQDTQPAAQDFPGTTEYIANKAGYPVPPSFSGQLGAAVGGVLTPGPGDLAKFAPLGAMFLGAKAKTALPDVLEYAQAMDKAGKSADEIWQTTGKLGQPWFKGADGKWRFEVSDKGATLNEDGGTLGTALQHPSLMGEYDGIGSVGVTYDPTLRGFGEASPAGIRLNPLYRSTLEPSDPLSTLLHETQHVLQNKEGFATGDNPARYMTDRETAYDWYKRSAGETEARNTQARMNMTMDERLALPPWATQDVPAYDQIVRFGDGPAMAIPFWHGSPHKYDTVDLSKIGTGEGAQAYGWGYYGADAKAVAEQYAQFNRAELANGNVIDPGPFDPEFGAIDALRASDGNYDSAKKALIDKQSRQQVDLSPEIAALESLQAKGAKPLDKNLYRGEYRWPDPAKEASTPLTGEDLLQWDRPLSEQPESVRSALRGMGYKFGQRDINGLEMTEMSARRTFNEAKNERNANVLISARRNMEDAAADLAKAREISDLSGGMFYREWLRGPDRHASGLLSQAGIPGIRYLDGMSRDGGKGTYNYVMFDDKGIKLLERNGSPIEDFAARRAGKAKPYKESLPMDQASRMQRARDMGFDTPAVHWSRHGVDVNELDSGKFAIAPFDAVGTHVGTPEAAMKRFEGWASPERGAGVTYPVVIKSKKPYLDPSGKPWNEQQLTEHLREIGGYDSARASYKELNSKLRDKIFAEYDSIPYINDVEDAGSISYIAPPQNIRSRFAAFDPAKKDSTNLLAGLAALGVGTAAVKSQQDKERRDGL